MNPSIHPLWGANLFSSSWGRVSLILMCIYVYNRHLPSYAVCFHLVDYRRSDPWLWHCRQQHEEAWGSKVSHSAWVLSGKNGMSPESSREWTRLSFLCLFGSMHRWQWLLIHGVISYLLTVLFWIKLLNFVEADGVVAFYRMSDVSNASVSVHSLWCLLKLKWSVCHLTRFQREKREAGFEVVMKVVTKEKNVSTLVYLPPSALYGPCIPPPLWRGGWGALAATGL